MLSFNPLNPMRDIRNTTVGFADDLYYFLSYHPLWSLFSGGSLMLAYGVYTWGCHVITYVTTQLSELIGLSNRYATTILETAHPPTLKPLTSWKFNPIQWIPTTWSPKYHYALWKTPSFQGYEIKLPDGHPCKGAGLLSTSIRPVNLLCQQIFKNSDIELTLPSSRNLFSYLFSPAPLSFNRSSEQVATFIKESAASSPHEVIAISAKGIKGKMNGVSITDLSEIFGSNTYELSRQEILDIASSSTIYTSRFLPVAFYKALEEAMRADGITQLPAIDLRDVRSLHLYLLLRRVQRDPVRYGFQGKDHFEKFCQLSFFQLSALLIKTEQFYPLIDGHGKILARKVYSVVESRRLPDAIQLVNMCGLKNSHRGSISDDCERMILRAAFKTALIACEQGMALFPTVGLTDGKDNPDLYWRSFLDAVKDTPTDLEWIGVNPEHAPTLCGIHKGSTGQEFQTILAEYIAEAKTTKNTLAIANLRKISNLYAERKDLLQLAKELKRVYPHTRLSIINGSNPHAILGNRIGAEINFITRQSIDSEANYSALGTKCLSSKTLSFQFPPHLIQT